MLFTYCVSVVSYWAGRVCCSHIVFLFLVTGQAGYVVRIIVFLFLVTGQAVYVVHILCFCC